MKYKKELIIASLIACTLTLLIYLETHLPFFKKFLPVGENKMIIIILNINLLLILLLLFLVTRALTKTYIEKKRGIWGSGLKTKLTTTLLFISIIPSFTLFILSTGFFHISMDKWFSQRIEDTLDNAIEFSRFYYDNMFERYEKAGSIIAQAITKQRFLNDKNGLTAFIGKSAKNHSVSYLSVYDLYGNSMAVSNSPRPEIEQKLLALIKASAHPADLREIIPLKEGELIVKGTAIDNEDGELRGILFVGDVLKVYGTERIREIAAAQKEFKESRPIKKILKYSFIIPLFLITIITIFFSIWVGIKMATEITIPIEKMKEGASIIATGKFDINLEDRGRDEIGTLVGAFNRMARELKITKDEIEERRRYMEVILDNVATGIISTDKRGNILLLNRAAQTILGIERDTSIGTPLKEIFGDEFRAHMKSFLKGAKGADGGSVTKEMRLNLKKDITYLRTSVTILKDEAKRIEGFIITFDDITHIVRAEKLATWREVAKKLTHEIKNPLTPIILSAERIRRRLLGNSEGKEKEVLEETTSVIIRSVDDIKEIVNELTKLTLTSQARTVEDLNKIIEETIGLYNNLYQNIHFQLDTGSIPPLQVDRDGIKRAMINLITNSVKAIDTRQGVIGVKTIYDKEKGVGIIEFTDTGAGIPDGDKAKIFDPYFTTDKNGTGLGLAIVHSIILEHHGRIHVEDNIPAGTRFIIELPVLTA
jgi:two-component system, NtrC family, nitrogen regulation sensor histidine kinase NtrY